MERMGYEIELEQQIYSDVDKLLPFAESLQEQLN